MEVSRRQYISILIGLVTIMFILEFTSYSVLSTLVWKSMSKVPLPQPIAEYLSTSPTNNIVAEKLMCPDITSGMLNGTWKTRPLTTKERTEIETFYESVYMSHGLPKSMQRADNICGNVSYPGRVWFRALCNPKGQTPCCYENRCVNKSPDKCHCANCYNLRTQIHAEYSTWKPADPRCPVKNYTATEAIHLLRGAQVVVVGDSLMRNLRTAFSLILSNNDFDGFIRPKLPRGIQGQCSGLNRFICRGQMLQNATFHNGDDSVTVSYIAAIDTRKLGDFMSMIQRLLFIPKTYVLISMGMKSNFRRTSFDKFLLPAIKMIESNNTIWPRIIWTTYHMFGILKTKVQGSESAKVYNQFMRNKVRQHDIPIFDISNVTVGVMSPDGCHFGYGINMMKAQMFLNFFEDLKRKGQL